MGDGEFSFLGDEDSRTIFGGREDKERRDGVEYEAGVYSDILHIRDREGQPVELFPGLISFDVPRECLGNGIKGKRGTLRDILRFKLCH